MARTLSALRSEVEAALVGRVPAPFSDGIPKTVPMVSTGNSEADLLTGGLPRGGITEICGPNCSGRTSLLMSALAARTSEAEACAFIDAADAFDPYSAQATGVHLDQLLWVRCHHIDQALRATDLLLHAGGFGLVALDLGEIPPETVRYVPLSVWFRFRRAVEHTPTIFLVLEQEPHAKTCASLVLRMQMETAHWSKTTNDHQGAMHEPHACLYSGSYSRAEVVRSRAKPISRSDFGAMSVTLESRYAAPSAN